MPQFRQKPVVIDAFQLPQEADDNVAQLKRWSSEVGFVTYYALRDGKLSIPTPKGMMSASPGDWIIKGVTGEFYSCSPDIFAATYEAVTG